MRPDLGLTLLGFGVFQLFEVVNYSIWQRAQQLAKAHQAGHPQSGAHRGQAVLVRVHVNKQVAGKQGFHCVNPAISFTLSQANSGQVGSKTLPLQVLLSNELLTGFALHSVPVAHDARACPANWSATMVAGVCCMSCQALSLP